LSCHGPQIMSIPDEGPPDPGRFSLKKSQKMLTKFPGLATSDRHDSALITDR